MKRRLERERDVACRPARRQAAHRPPGEDLRKLLHVLLRVTTIHTERVQLQQLARVVLVEPAPLSCAASPGRAQRGGTNRLEVVEIYEHRRMLRRRKHEVLETSEDMRPDRLAFVAAGEWRHQHLRARGHAQMIRPEGDQPLHERTLGDDARRQSGVAFGGSNLHQTASCLPPLLLALGNAGLRRAEGLQRLSQARARGYVWRTHERRTAVELSEQPSTPVANAGRFTDARPQAEPVQGAKGCVHRATLCSSRTAADLLFSWTEGQVWRLAWPSAAE